MDGKRGAGLRTPALSGSVGASGLCLAPGQPPETALASCSPPGAVPGRFRNVGSLRLLPASRRPRKLLPERCRGEKRHWGGLGEGASAGPSPSSPSWGQPRRTCCPHTVETTSAAPRDPAACVRGSPPLPKGTEVGCPLDAHPGSREKRKCFIYGTYLISLFN